MKVDFIAFYCVFAHALLLRFANASCTADDGPCQKGSGSCFTAVQLALSGNLLDGITALSYGKYCGANNKCQVLEKTKWKKGGIQLDENTCVQKNNDNDRSLQQKKRESDNVAPQFVRGGNPPRSNKKQPCPAIPCDAIDTSCSGHDSCLDQEIFINPPPQGERVPIPQRCHCDVDLVASLVVQASTTAPTGLCDAAFYNATIAPTFPVTPIALLQHEAVLIAAPFCCTTLDPGCAADATAGGGSTDPTRYAMAKAFCDGLLAQFASQGISLCAS